MKLSDYVVSFLVTNGLKHAFIISGGASIHLLHSLEDSPDIEAVCTHHEQAAAMSADGYARAVNSIGCAIGTSGPGATNMITGIAGAWFDSVPVLFISGQVATYRMKGDTGVRQMGFQETDILPMVEPITKHAVQITDKRNIAFELEKAIHIAKSGRPGPVLVDIPDDLQREMIDPDALPHFSPEATKDAPGVFSESRSISQLLNLVSEAQRPVLIAGWGIRLADAFEKFHAVKEKLGIPVLTSWAAKDILTEDDPLNAGTFGTHGTRGGNFTVQNSDLVIAVGARLSTRETGSPMTSWARGAKLVVVDIDEAELRKFPTFGKHVDLPIHSDAGVFLEKLGAALDVWESPSIGPWLEKVENWKKRYPAQRLGAKIDTIDPYLMMKTLSGVLTENEHIFLDTGCSVAWAMQSFPVRGRQRLFHDFNNTSMGWALPAAIGGSFALGRAPVTCISGDGSLMMNLQEFATIERHQLPIRTIIVNNEGYSMVRQTQEQWLGGKYIGTSIEGGLGFPDFATLAEAFRLPHLLADKDADVSATLGTAFEKNGPVVVEIKVPANERVTPQSRFGYPIEDSEPLLPRDEFMESMIIPPMSKSMEPVQ